MPFDTVILGLEFLKLNKLILDVNKQSVARSNDDGSSWQLYASTQTKPQCIVHRRVPVYAVNTVAIAQTGACSVQVHTSTAMGEMSGDARDSPEMYYDGQICKRLLGSRVIGVEGELEWNENHGPSGRRMYKHRNDPRRAVPRLPIHGYRSRGAIRRRKTERDSY